MERLTMSALVPSRRGCAEGEPLRLMTLPPLERPVDRVDSRCRSPRNEHWIHPPEAQCSRRQQALPEREGPRLSAKDERTGCLAALCLPSGACLGSGRHRQRIPCSAKGPTGTRPTAAVGGDPVMGPSRGRRAEPGKHRCQYGLRPLTRAI